MKMQIPNTFIKPSSIHGLGLFANRDIKKGEEIIHGNVDYSFYKEWQAYMKITKEKSFAFTNGYCMVNHSKTPNTRRGKEFTIIAASNILKGSEITENYNALPENENPFKNNIEEFYFKCKNGYSLPELRIPTRKISKR